jgi:hypothetical protein
VKLARPLSMISHRTAALTILWLGLSACYGASYHFEGSRLGVSPPPDRIAVIISPNDLHPWPSRYPLDDDSAVTLLDAEITGALHAMHPRGQVVEWSATKRELARAGSLDQWAMIAHRVDLRFMENCWGTYGCPGFRALPVDPTDSIATATVDRAVGADGVALVVWHTPERREGAVWARLVVVDADTRLSWAGSAFARGVWRTVADERRSLVRCLALVLDSLSHHIDNSSPRAH